MIKTFNYKELRRIFNGLHMILSLTQQKTSIHNVWVESPAGKGRQLGVHNQSLRYYLKMLNQFLTYVYSPHLSRKIYDGFIYERGCKS
jgi:hypothetical protein